MLTRFKQWIQRRTYRNLVKSMVRLLLSAIPKENYKLLLSAYPGVQDRIDEAYDSGENPHEEGVRIASSIVSDVLEKNLSDNERSNILESLKSKMESTDSPAVDAAADAWVTVILTLETEATRMAKAGKIDEVSIEILMSEVVGALRGQDYRERSKNRILDKLTEGMGLNK